MILVVKFLIQWLWFSNDPRRYLQKVSTRTFKWVFEWGEIFQVCECKIYICVIQGYTYIKETIRLVLDLSGMKCGWPLDIDQRLGWRENHVWIWCPRKRVHLYFNDCCVLIWPGICIRSVLLDFLLAQNSCPLKSLLSTLKWWVLIPKLVRPTKEYRPWGDSLL